MKFFQLFKFLKNVAFVNTLTNNLNTATNFRLMNIS